MDETNGRTIRDSTLVRDWTQGSVIRNLLSLSWPMIVSYGFYMVGQTVDMLCVGRLGAASIAGVGVAGIVIMLILTAKFGLVTGARAIIARFIGGGDVAGANYIAQQAFVISFTYGVLMTVIGYFLAEPILRLFGLEADVVAEGATYMRIVMTGWLAMSVWLMAFSIMQASGDSVTPMWISIFIRVVHVTLCPFLVFGWWIFPALGVSGAAISNVVYQIIGMVVALWVLFRGRSRLRLTLKNFRIDTKAIWRIVKISLPASVMGVQANLGQLALTWFMVSFGTYAVAAHSLVQRVEMILFLPSMGLGVGAGVLVGQNLGAGQPQRAERSGWLAVSFVEGFMITCSIAILIWAENIIGIFNIEPELVTVGGVFLRIAVVGYVAVGFTAVLQNSITGSGDTIPPMLISLAMIWIIQLPLAFFLSQSTGVGVYGVRWAIVAGMLSGAIAYVTYYRRGRWKRKQV